MSKKELDFSVRGMTKLLLYYPDKIYEHLVLNTSNVKRSLYKAYVDKPDNSTQLLKHFLSLVYQLETVEKIEFRAKWETSLLIGLQYRLFNQIDKKWISLLDSSIDEITETGISQLEFNKILLNAEREDTSCEAAVPVVKEDIVDNIYTILKPYFQPQELFLRCLRGEEVSTKINFIGDQNKLAGIFVTLRENDDAIFGTHEQTYQFIKNTFLVKGKAIKSKQVLSYLKEPGKVDAYGNEVVKGKANRKNWIDISI